MPVPSVPRRVALVTALTLLLVPALSAAPAHAGRPTPLERARAGAAARTAPVSPFTALQLAVDPSSQAALAAAAARGRGDLAAATALDVIARRPQAAWYGDGQATSTVAADVSRRVTASARVGATETLVLYAVPHRDCGGFSAGGRTAAGYRAWVREVARGLAGRRTVVVVEPDALALLDCLPPALQTERLDLLADAARVLTAAGALVYLDAGHADWVPAGTMAARLQAAGVAQARGVALNVSGFGRTADQAAYAGALAARLPGLRAVVDTSRNGNGPAPDAAWCNPAGRALGAAPGAATGVVEALLWVKRPGESDGDCGRGEPSAGRFWVESALSLVAASA